uniref:Uncharacterized protein n=1 Tax=Gopherus evgoodei TaxID=1825980 RepID=A0A8C4YG19_9SAUR
SLRPLCPAPSRGRLFREGRVSAERRESGEEPVRSVRPSAPYRPLGMVRSVGPSAPCRPLGKVRSVGPSAPCRPLGKVRSVGPSAPCQPLGKCPSALRPSHPPVPQQPALSPQPAPALHCHPPSITSASPGPG